MSLVASIQIYECDECRAMISIRTDEDFKRLKNDWFWGIRCQFCPTCSDDPNTRIRRRTEQRFMDAIADMRAEQMEEAWPHYVH